MAPWRYEISLRVMKNISQVSAAKECNIFFQNEKRNFISPSGHVMFYLSWKHQWNTKRFHFFKIVFAVKGIINKDLSLVPPLGVNIGLKVLEQIAVLCTRIT